MDLKRNGVSGKSKPSYPDVGEVNRDRRAFLLRFGGGVLGLSLLGLEGCRTPGEPVVTPVPPEVPVLGGVVAPPPGPEPEPGGKVAPPVEPPEMPPLPGEPMVPPKPVPTPPDPGLVHMKGDVAEPPLPTPPTPNPSEEKDVVEEGEVVPDVDQHQIRTGGIAPNIEPVNLPGEAPNLEPNTK